MGRLSEICDHSHLNIILILATLLIDDNNSHEYFGHKYSISNDIKDNLNMIAKNLELIKRNKDFFKKDLEKNIYLYNKDHLIHLNVLNFVINTKIKIQDFQKNLKRILKSKIHKLSFDGNYLMKNGLQQGVLIGKVLKKIEEEWIRNNFKITQERVQELIRQHSN